MFCNIEFGVCFVPILHGFGRNRILNRIFIHFSLLFHRVSFYLFSLIKNYQCSWLNSPQRELEAKKWRHTDTSRLIEWGSTRDTGSERKRLRSAKLTRVLKQSAYVATLHCTVVHCKWNNEKLQHCKRLKCLKLQMRINQNT